MRAIRFGLVSCVLATVAAVLPASASVIPVMALEQIHARANRVIQGTVIDQTSFWHESEGHHLIITHSTIRVARAWKQDIPENGHVVVRTIGGEVEGYHQTLLGEAALSPNEEVVLFLQDEEGWEHPSVVGFYQGKYRVEHDEKGEAVSLIRDKGQRPGGVGKVDQRLSMTSFVRKMQNIERAGTKPPPSDETEDENAKRIHPLVPEKR